MQWLFFAVIVSVMTVASVHGQEPEEEPNSTMPGTEHKNLMAFVGNWELVVEGVEEKGFANIRSILGGRFITEDVKLPFGDVGME